MKLGYKASAEQFDPVTLLEFSRQAEQIGLEMIGVSDHFQPWRHHGGHAPAALTWLGAAAMATERAVLGTSVLTPTLRYHPSMVAQSFALGCLAPGRVFLGVGTGEALNEHIFGDAWPSTDIRLEMLEEAIEVMRLLWEGGTKSHEGRHYIVENARIYTLPKKSVPIHVAGSGPRAAALAGEIGDGFIGTAPERDLLKAFDRAGTGKRPRY